MTEKLTIRNFGPIVDVELILCPVTVLIGDQGTGKSTIAKLLDVIKEAFNIVEQSLVAMSSHFNNSKDSQNRPTKQQNFKRIFFALLKNYELNNYLRNGTFLHYQNNKFNVVFSNNDVLLVDILSDPGQIEPVVFLNYYIPAFREAFILLRKNYPAILSAKATLPLPLNNFGQHFYRFREDLKQFNFKDIIGVDYKYLDGRETIISDNGQELTFEESSSAINSVVPMLVVVSGVTTEEILNNFLNENHNIKPSIIVEEPELNCFPQTQKNLVDYIVKAIQNRGNFLVNLLITTHSPYILSALNNLMSGFEAASIDSKQVEKLYPGKTWLNPKDVSVYLLKDGLIEDIMDYEQHLIKVDKIDAVSDILNEEFESFLKIQL